MTVCSSRFVVDNISMEEKEFSDWVDRGIGIYMYDYHVADKVRACLVLLYNVKHISIIHYNITHMSNKSHRMKA
jgi:hypothetical protein